MNVNDMFPSKYLKADDIQADTPVVISHLVYEMVAEESKPVLYFQGCVKGMILNKTNTTSIAQAHNMPETDRWSGLQMLLVREFTDWPAPNTPCLRLRPSLQQPVQTVAAPGTPAAGVAPILGQTVIPNAAAVRFTEASPPPPGNVIPNRSASPPIDVPVQRPGVNEGADDGDIPF